MMYARKIAILIKPSMAERAKRLFMCTEKRLVIKDGSAMNSPTQSTAAMTVTTALKTVLAFAPSFLLSQISNFVGSSSPPEISAERIRHL